MMGFLIKSVNEEIILKIRRILRERKRKEIHDPELTRAAVLLPLFEKEEKLHILLTKRTETVRDHKGQISFPGGAEDAHDADVQATALREAHEEVGLLPEHVNVLGLLDDMVTITNYIVTPAVGIFSYPYPFQTSHKEIAKLLEVPVQSLLVPEKYSEVVQTGYRNKPYVVPFFHYEGEQVWGATGRIIKELLELVYEWKPPGS